MKTKMLWVGAMSLALSAGSVLAEDFKVEGKSASGRPGEQVFVEVVYDYGAGFQTIAEDLQFEYQSDGVTFNPTFTTIGASGAPMGLMAYYDALKAAATALSGSALLNLDVIDPPPGLKAFALSFAAASGAQRRSGQVHLNLAFDIDRDAAPGVRTVSLAKSGLADFDGNEFSYPNAMQQLSVTVVPEPQIALLLLPGLALVGLYARRRSARNL